jgi:hypothetical protein
MAVNFNSIGNNNAKLINENYQRVNTKKGAVGDEKKINKDEKLFFANLYPEKRNEIMDYSFYERSGKMNGISLGTNFDKKG